MTFSKKSGHTLLFPIFQLHSWSDSLQTHWACLSVFLWSFSQPIVQTFRPFLLNIHFWYGLGKSGQVWQDEIFPRHLGLFRRSSQFVTIFPFDGIYPGLQIATQEALSHWTPIVPSGTSSFWHVSWKAVLLVKLTGFPHDSDFKIFALISK